MKKLKVFITVIGVLFVCSMNAFICFAEETEKEKMLLQMESNISLSILQPPKPIDSIVCFDVNKNGFVALGCDGIKGQTIWVYDGNGEYQYGFSLNFAGDFAIEWKNNDLWLHMVRGNSSLLINRKGSCIDWKEAVFDDISHWNTLRSPVKAVEDQVFLLRSNTWIFSTTYSQAVKIDEDGKETIFYDVSSSHIIRVGLLVTFVLSLIGVCVIKIIIPLFCERFKPTPSRNQSIIKPHE